MTRRKATDTGISVPRSFARKMQFIKVDPKALYFIKIDETAGIPLEDVSLLKQSLKGIGANNVMVIMNEGITVGKQGERQVSTGEKKSNG